MEGRPGKFLLLGVLLLFSLVEAGPLASSGAAFVGSDETFGYLTSRSVAEKGTTIYDLPFGDWAPHAFSPLTAYTPVPQARFGISSAFAHMYAPLAWAGPAGVLAGATLMSVLLLVGIYLTAREAFGPEAATLAVAVAAFVPPFLFFASTFYANVTMLAFFFLGMAALARALTRGRPAWIVPAVVLVGLAVAMRRDGVVLALPLVVAAFAIANRRRHGWLLVALGLLAAMVAWVFANRIDLYRMDLRTGPLEVILSFPSRLRETVDLSLVAIRQTHPSLSWEVFASNGGAYLLGAAPLVVLFGALCALFAPRPARGSGLLLGSMLLAGVVYCAFYLTWDLRSTLDPPGLNSSLVRYTLLVPLTLAIFTGAFLARLLRLFPQGRPRVAVAVVLVACFAVPGLVHAATAEPGLVWLHRQREWRAGFAAEADLLPPDAIVLGDEPSIFLFSRPVLVPVYSGTPAVTAYVDRLAEMGRRTFVHEDTWSGDWSGRVGDFATDRAHFATQSGVGSFLEIRRTNTTLGNVGILWADHWRLDDAGRVESLAPYSYVELTPSFARSLWSPPSPGVLVTMTYVDDAMEWHQAGYVNEPKGPNDVLVTHRWLGAGTGEARTETFFVPADRPINGPFFVSGGLAFETLRIEPHPGVVAR